MQKLRPYHALVLDLTGEPPEKGISPFIDIGGNRISLMKAVDALLASLPSEGTPNMRQVLELYYGLNDGRRLDVSQIAERFGFVGDQVQQLRGGALRLLQQNPDTEKLRLFINPLTMPPNISALRMYRREARQPEVSAPLARQPLNADQRALDQAFLLLRKRLREKHYSITGVVATKRVLSMLGILGLSELQSAVEQGSLLGMQGIGPARMLYCQEVLKIAQKMEMEEPRAPP